MVRRDPIAVVLGLWLAVGLGAFLASPRPTNAYLSASAGLHGEISAGSWLMQPLFAGMAVGPDPMSAPAREQAPARASAPEAPEPSVPVDPEPAPEPSAPGPPAPSVEPTTPAEPEPSSETSAPLEPAPIQEGGAIELGAPAPVPASDEASPTVDPTAPENDATSPAEEPDPATEEPGEPMRIEVPAETTSDDPFTSPEADPSAESTMAIDPVAPVLNDLAATESLDGPVAP